MLKPDFQSVQYNSSRSPTSLRKHILMNPVLKINSARLKSRRELSNNPRHPHIEDHSSFPRKANSAMGLQRKGQPRSNAIKRMGNLYAAETFYPGVLPTAQKLKDSIIRRKRCNSQQVEDFSRSNGTYPDFAAECEQPVFFGRNIELHRRLYLKKSMIQQHIRNQFKLRKTTQQPKEGGFKKWSTESSIDYF